MAKKTRMAVGNASPGTDFNYDPLWSLVREIETPIELVVTDAIKSMERLHAVVFAEYEGKAGKNRLPKIYISVLDAGNHRNAEGVECVLNKLESLNAGLRRRGMPKLLIKEREGKILVAPNWRKIACDEAHLSGTKIEFPTYFGTLSNTCANLSDGREL